MDGWMERAEEIGNIQRKFIEIIFTKKLSYHFPISVEVDLESVN